MNTTASYNAHIKTHKDFKCEICNETFNQKIKYMSHMGTHETGKVLECNICGKKFGRSSNFYNHQRIHMGIKKFKCYICGWLDFFFNIFFVNFLKMYVFRKWFCEGSQFRCSSIDSL